MSKNTATPKAVPALLPTLNDLPKPAREKSVILLNQVLADLSDLHSHAKYAHWNVRGPGFFPQHELFDKLAGEFFEPLDDIAERIVALGGTARGTVRAIAAASALPEFPSEAGKPGFIVALAERAAGVAKSVRAGVDATAGAGDTGTSDLLTGLSRTLDKALWFLEAHTRV
ncbi:MAG: DNA starvation/stationary phase protection protein Dps [Puniceicoccales bacterium]|jgi:starvation-inducible DNA-binding protein|nr:DNA starvation/stationary phase protection protein Dps [Puniceicoccales bacterium]